MQNNATLKRIPLLDSLRGAFHIQMMVDHLPIIFPGLFTVIGGIYECLGYFTAAEGFVFLSGYVSGLVYTRTRAQQGDGALWKKALVRARNIYLCYILAAILMQVLVRSLGISNGHLVYQTSTLPEPFVYHSLKIVALVYQPAFLEILPMYCLLLLVTPWIVQQLDRGNHLRIVFASILIWFGRQYWNPTALLNSLAPSANISFGYFSFYAWQILFVAGLICGHKTYCAKGHWVRVPTIVSLGVLVAALGFFLLRHELIPGISIPFRLVDRSCVGPLRLLNFACLTFLLVVTKRHFENHVSVKGLALLSRNSLQVFAFHLIPVALVAVMAEKKSHWPIWLQLLVVAVCIAWLFQTAFFMQMYKDFRSRSNHVSKSGEPAARRQQSGPVPRTPKKESQAPV
jgi:hypothetical protein